MWNEPVRRIDRTEIAGLIDTGACGREALQKPVPKLEWAFLLWGPGVSIKGLKEYVRRNRDRFTGFHVSTEPKWILRSQIATSKQQDSRQ
jgi:hypothetical protein